MASPLARPPHLLVVLDAPTLEARGRDPVGVVESILSEVAGHAVAFVERDKRRGGDRARLARLSAMAARTTEAAAALIVTGRPDLAMMVGAWGVQLPERGLSVEAVREAFPELAIGRSCHDADGARAARASGVDWITAAPVFEPISKSMISAPLELTGLESLAAEFAGPTIALGGMTVSQVAEVRRTGAAGVGSVGAVTLSSDPGAAANALLKAWHTASPG